MTGEPRYWVWVFGDIACFGCVLAERTVAFPKTATSRLGPMAERDRAILYKGTLHDSAGDTARLGGLGTVLAPPADDPPVTIGDEEFAWTVPIRVDLALPECAGLEVRPPVPRLSFVHRPDVWGMDLRSSPQEIPEADFRVLADAAKEWGTRG